MKPNYLALPITAIILGGLSFTQPAFAGDTKPAAISVSATGTATVAPDMAIINLAVMREGKTAREALSANTAAMAKVLAALEGAGIAKRDLQTSNFNIQPRYHYAPPSKTGEQRPPKIVGYIVNNALTVRVRKLAELGSILDTVVTLGANSGGDISFTTDKPEQTIQRARKNAMSRAIAKAKTLTSAAGIKLGPILEISEHNRGRPQPRAMGRMAKNMATESAAPVPVASGENSYSVTVNVRWELSQ